MDEMLTRAVRFDQQLLANNATLAAQARDARGRIVGRRARRRHLRAVASRTPRPIVSIAAVDLPPAVA